MEYNIAVLMSTYNGIKYIDEAIRSIMNQTVQCDLYIRDDGSDADFINHLKQYENSNKRIKVFVEKNIGPAKSFLALLKKVNKYDYYAFADQDDYWLPEKLEKAINQFHHVAVGKPGLYCSKLTVTDSKLNIIRGNYGSVQTDNLFSNIFRSTITGCTVVINDSLRVLVNKSNPTEIIMHDQWISIVAAAAKSFFFFDKNSYILYRQHENNVVGANNIVNRFRHSVLFNNNNNRRYQLGELIKNYPELFNESEYERLNDLLNYGSKNIIQRIVLASSIYREQPECISITDIISIILRRF
ncbi:glycosyltransferase [Ileibacterium valens]|uniref:glycosyltransferase n=1 Tax=Ileibacterium valens TaxID=1862668 RepID=UPI00272CCC34|nr:glycosyltransferase [Ileibacterium valens]